MQNTRPNLLPLSLKYIVTELSSWHVTVPRINCSKFRLGFKLQFLYYSNVEWELGSFWIEHLRFWVTPKSFLYLAENSIANITLKKIFLFNHFCFWCEQNGFKEVNIRDWLKYFSNSRNYVFFESINETGNFTNRPFVKCGC